MNDSDTDFGFTRIPFAEKAKRVAEVFHSVADKYDVMNDVMSLGVHRLWKRYFVAQSGVREGDHVLDIASGTGDISKLLAQRVGKQGLVIASDINASMLVRGRDKLIDAGFRRQTDYVLCDAERLPLAEHSFHGATLAFGLRNMTDKLAALKSIFRTLKPGARLSVLEFSTPALPLLAKCYDAYSFKLLPAWGEFITGDRASYEYLVQSIRRHPDQATLQGMFEEAGFTLCDYINLSGGIVAIHRGIKP